MKHALIGSVLTVLMALPATGLPPLMCPHPELGCGC